MSDYYNQLPFKVDDDPSALSERVKALNDDRNENNLELGMLLLAAKDREYYYKCGCSDFNEYVRDKLGMSISTARRHMNVCNAIKEMEIPASKVKQIRFTDFSKFLPLIKNGTISQEEFLEHHLPTIMSGSPKLLSTTVVDERLTELKKTNPANKRQTIPVTMDAVVESSIDVIRSDETYKDVSLSDIVARGLSLMSESVSKDQEYTATFSQAANFEVLLNSCVPPGLLFVPVIYDQDKFLKSIKTLADLLPSDTHDDQAIHSQIRAFLKVVVDAVPKVCFDAKEQAIITMEPDKYLSDVKQVILDKSLIPAHAHCQFDMSSIVAQNYKLDPYKAKLKTKTKTVESRVVEPTPVPEAKQPEPKQPEPKQKVERKTKLTPIEPIKPEPEPVTEEAPDLPDLTEGAPKKKRKRRTAAELAEASGGAPAPTNGAAAAPQEKPAKLKVQKKPKPTDSFYIHEDLKPLSLIDLTAKFSQQLTLGTAYAKDGKKDHATMKEIAMKYRALAGFPEGSKRTDKPDPETQWLIMAAALTEILYGKDK